MSIKYNFFKHGTKYILLAEKEICNSIFFGEWINGPKCQLPLPSITLQTELLKGGTILAACLYVCHIADQNWSNLTSLSTVRTCN